jgi:biotin carboxyl carrier protein
MTPDIFEVEPGVYLALIDGAVHEARVDGGTVTIHGVPYTIDRPDPRKYVRRAAGSSAVGHGAIEAPMPGKIVRVLVSVGDQVEAGQGIVVIEAMKMQNELKAPSPGRVASVSVQANDAVIAGAVLAVIE